MRPHDIAILVNTNDQCSSVQAAFTGQGVPAVVAGFPEIFHVAIGLTEKPRNWRDLLKMDRPRYIAFTGALLRHGVRALERGAWFLSTEHDDEVIDATLEAVQGLRPIAEQAGLSMSQLALAWVLREDNVA